MYKLSESLDLKPLLGKEVIQVAIGQYQVILNLTEEFSIYIGGQYIYRKKSLFSKCSAENPQETKELVVFIGEKITEINIENEAILVMSFTKDNQLKLIDDSELYESFSISGPSFNLTV